MSDGGTGRGESPRRGLVLGAGGVLGAAWAMGALAALEDHVGFDARDADVLLGTSAGSVLAALLAAGLPTSVLLDNQRGVPLPGGLGLSWDHDTSTGGALPARPPLRIGSRELLRRASRREVPLRTGFWAVVPPGRRTLEPLGRVIDEVVGAGAWAPRDGVRIVALDYVTGERVAFGAADAPPATLCQAVCASCAIPGWFAPVTIGGRVYVDGGTRSAASVDLVAADGLDEVFVLAPLASLELDRPTGVAARLERRWRRLVTARTLAEAELVRTAGARVTVICPGREDLEVIGPNLMDPSRRLDVVETALRTTPRALRRAAAGVTRS